MEKIFRMCSYWFHHKIKKLGKEFPQYHQIKEKFLASKNARLIVILLIAAAIPITVLGVQQIQDIRQQAAEEKPPPCTPDGYPLRVSKNPANDGEKIQFSHAEEAIDRKMFEEEDFTGNGAKNCELKGSVIECDARYNSKSGKPQSDHTYEFRGNKCLYTVLKPVKPSKAPKPTKNPNNTPTTKPPRDPDEPTTSPKCEVKLDPAACTGENEPRFKASWDIGDNEKGCVVELDGTKISKECQYGNLNIIEYGKKPLESGKTYELAISNNGSCKQKVSAKAPTCATKDPTATPKGNPTATPKPGTPTPTPKGGSSSCSIAAKFNCNTTDSRQSRIELSLNLTPGKCIVTGSSSTNSKFSYDKDFEKSTCTGKTSVVPTNLKKGDKLIFKGEADNGNGCKVQTNELTYPCAEIIPAEATKIPMTPAVRRPGSGAADSFQP